jgi:predicted amidohydrolase
VPPDYVWSFDKLADGSVSFERTLQAPAGTTAVDVELVLQWAADGHFAFDKLSLVPTAAPAARKVRVAAVQYRPSGSRSGLESVQKAAAYASQVASANHPDVIVLGELLNVIGAPGTFESKAEPIPGPSTEAVAAVARAQHVNIVFGMIEKEGSQLFNTAVLIGRDGNIVGKHHKVQLPLSDAALGITPGSAVEVFDTDFGRVGILICQDASFPEPAREAALQGAEILLVPIWGGKTTLLHARAVENGIHLAAAGYDYASEIVNPLGTVLSSVVVDRAPHAAIADIDLSQRFREDYLGDWRDISAKERRTDPYPYRLP